MDDFDGVVWNVSGAHDAEGSGTFRRIGDQLQPGERGIEHTVEIEVHALDGPWLPTVGWLKELRFTSEIARSQRSELRYNDSTGTALIDRKSTRLNSSHVAISYAYPDSPSFPTRRSSDLTFRRIGDQLQPGERGIEHTVEIEVHALDGPWLPTVGWLKELRFTSEIARSQRSELRYNDSTGTALMPPGLTPNTSYELTAIVPSQISDDALLRAKAGSVVLPEPKNVPDAVITAASAATREASSPIGIARALEQSLSEQGWF